MSNKNFYLSSGGGLGDLMDNYLGRVVEWGYLEEVKKAHPDCKIKVVLCIHNEQSRTFLEANPYIDELIWCPYRHDGTPVYEMHRGDYQDLSVLKLRRNFTYKVPEIHLTQEDKDVVDPIISDGPYVFMHPFAGETRRSWPDHYDIKTIIDALCNLGKRVVVVGGSYERTAYLNSVIGQDLSIGQMEEVLDYERDGLVNLVGKCNSRIAAYLCQKAERFIGTHSCYILVAWRTNIPALCIAPNWMTSHFQNHDNSCWGFERSFPQNSLVYYDKVDEIGIDAVVNEWTQNPSRPFFDKALCP